MFWSVLSGGLSCMIPCLQSALAAFVLRTTPRLALVCLRTRLGRKPRPQASSPAAWSRSASRAPWRARRAPSARRGHFQPSVANHGCVHTSVHRRSCVDPATMAPFSTCTRRMHVKTASLELLVATQAVRRHAETGAAVAARGRPANHSGNHGASPDSPDRQLTCFPTAQWPALRVPQPHGWLYSRRSTHSGQSYT